MTKAYISGPMSGLPEFNFPAFFRAADELKGMGYDPLNPADGVNDFTQHWTWYMRRAIKLLMDADEIWMLPGWRASKGARVERLLAKVLQMPVRYFTSD